MENLNSITPFRMKATARQCLLCLFATAWPPALAPRPQDNWAAQLDASGESVSL